MVHRPDPELARLREWRRLVRRVPPGWSPALAGRTRGPGGRPSRRPPGPGRVFLSPGCPAQPSRPAYSIRTSRAVAALASRGGKSSCSSRPRAGDTERSSSAVNAPSCRSSRSAAPAGRSTWRSSSLALLSSAQIRSSCGVSPPHRRRSALAREWRALEAVGVADL